MKVYFLILLNFIFFQMNLICQKIPVSESNPFSCSSSLPNSKTADYSPANICDLDESTAWVEGIKGNGLNQWVAIYLGKMEELKSIDELAVKILPGYAKSSESYFANNIPTQLKLELFIDETLITSKELNCPILEIDEYNTDCFFGYNEASLKFENKRLNKGFLWLKVTINKIYKGKKWDDTAISEIICNIKNADPYSYLKTLNEYCNAIMKKKDNVVKTFTAIPLKDIYDKFDASAFYDFEKGAETVRIPILLSSKKALYHWNPYQCGCEAALFEYNNGKWSLKRFLTLSF